MKIFIIRRKYDDDFLLSINGDYTFGTVNAKFKEYLTNELTHKIKTLNTEMTYITAYPAPVPTSIGMRYQEIKTLINVYQNRLNQCKPSVKELEKSFNSGESYEFTGEEYTIKRVNML